MSSPSQGESVRHLARLDASSSAPRARANPSDALLRIHAARPRARSRLWLLSQRLLPEKALLCARGRPMMKVLLLCLGVASAFVPPASMQQLTRASVTSSADVTMAAKPKPLSPGSNCAPPARHPVHPLLPWHPAWRACRHGRRYRLAAPPLHYGARPASRRRGRAGANPCSSWPLPSGWAVQRCMGGRSLTLNMGD